VLRAAVASKFLHLVIVTAESKDPYQGSASIVYVKEQMGHGSIQVTVDTYGHLIPGANVSFVDRSDEIPTDEPKNKSATIRNPRATKRNRDPARSPASY
jgi:hypothetical protein